MNLPLTMKHGTVMTPEEEQLPIGPISRVIENWIKEYTADHHDPGGNHSTLRYVTDKSEHEGPLVVLSFHCGVSARRLRFIRNGKFEVGCRKAGTYRFVDWVPFDVADKIVCGTVGPLAWHTEPLNQYYGPLTVKPSERDFEHVEEAA